MWRGRVASVSMSISVSVYHFAKASYSYYKYSYPQVIITYPQSYPQARGQL